jgi:dienelactone hydrolase
MQTQLIPYHDGDTPLTGFLVFDETRESRVPGVLVVHGGAGLDEHARNRATMLAAQGYVVFACDMYGDGVAGDRGRVLAVVTGLRDSPEALCRRAAAGMAVLGTQPLCDGRMAAVGYCFGGMTVLQLARSGAELAGVVSVHGGLSTGIPASPGLIAAKVLVCHGALDPHVPWKDVTGFGEEMDGSGADWQLVVYGRAMHGFTHENADGKTMPGVAYDELADRRSARAIEMFLREVFQRARGV